MTPALKRWCLRHSIAKRTRTRTRDKGELPTKAGAPARYTGIRLITAHVEDTDAVHEELKGRGVEIKVPPHDFQGLARVMFITDPDGNFIELASPLKQQRCAFERTLTGERRVGYAKHTRAFAERRRLLAKP